MRDHRFQVRSRQVPVGQGGMMTCDIRAWSGHEDDPPYQFRFAFDCGSINREHFQQGIETLDEGMLDILFISHLDTDHVNGIDLLLGKVSVTTVVLPCLDALQITAILCGALTVGGLTGNLRSLLVNPVAWFSERGVKRIIYVTRDNSEDPAPTFGPDEDSPNFPLTMIATEESFPSRLSYGIRGDLAQPRVVDTKSGRTEVRIVSPANAIKVDLATKDDKHRELSWLLVPYVHPFAPQSVDAFKRAIKVALKIPDTRDTASSRFTQTLLRKLKNETDRTLLKSCYALLASDHNKASLSLYSGPTSPEHNDIETLRSDVNHYSRYPYVVAPSSYQYRPGWLCTGDANLGSKGTREPWLRRYAKLLQSVGTFVLPHHGSNASLSSEVIDCIPHALTLACAALRRKHHPHPALLARLRARQLGVWQVSESPESEFSTNVYMTA